MVFSGGDGHGVAEPSNLHWLASIRVAPVPELPVVVVAPRPDPAVARESDGVALSARNGDRIIEHVDERRTVRGRNETSLAQLPVPVVAPSPDGSVVGQGEGVGATRAHSRDGRQRGHPIGTPPGVRSACTDLGDPAPSPQGAVGPQPQRVTLAASQCRNCERARQRVLAVRRRARGIGRLEPLDLQREVARRNRPAGSYPPVAFRRFAAVRRVV